MTDIQVDLGHGRNAGGQHQRRCNSRNLPCCRTCSVLTTSAVFTTKSTFSRRGEATPQARRSRSLLKCPAAPRNSGLRWVEGGSHEYVRPAVAGMRSEQRSRTAQRHFALWVARSKRKQRREQRFKFNSDLFVIFVFFC